MTEFQDEVIVGRHESGIELQEGRRTSSLANYCSKCNKNVHTFVKIDKETGEAVVHVTCTNKECMCKCKTHYECKKCGRLHPYGENCNYKEPESLPKYDAFIEQLNKQFRESQKSLSQEKK